MSQSDTGTVRLKVSPQVARIVAPGAPREVQMAAARGALPLSGADLLTTLCFLCANPDAEVKGEAVGTLRTLPASILMPVLDDPSLHPRILDLLTRVRLADVALMERVIMHPASGDATLLFMAERAGQPVLERLADNQLRLTPAIVEAIVANPHAEKVLKFRLGWREEPEVVEEVDEDAAEDFPEAVDGNPDEVEEVSETELEQKLKEAEKKGMSKHQLALEMGVSEKIKMAMTGDKEWRNILIKDPNKLVHGAVLKNGRVTEPEVVVVARAKTSSDELIRLILLNREWMKNSQIRRALAVHPKTPLPKALRFVSGLTTDDLKKMMKSKGLASAIVTTARKEFEQRQKRGGG
ncbi:MAG: hypothetical protein FIB02_05920 [Desulfuromonas sp.]|nr:hypothetical protein [Desulfuromonas sp.]